MVLHGRTQPYRRNLFLISKPSNANSRQLTAVVVDTLGLQHGGQLTVDPYKWK
jgi:hypothetical protein